MNMLKSLKLRNANFLNKRSCLLNIKCYSFKDKTNRESDKKSHEFFSRKNESIKRLADEYFFKKQEFDKSYKFLSEEMKDAKSYLIYSRKFSKYSINSDPKKFTKWLFYNSIFYMLYVNGIYNLMFIWVFVNIQPICNWFIYDFLYAKTISSIFIIKTYNDFTNENDFYFIIDYGSAKKVEKINLINFSSAYRAELEDRLYLIDDSQVNNIGYNIQFTYLEGEVLIVNKEIFRYFFKQEKQLKSLREKNQNESSSSEKEEELKEQEEEYDIFNLSKIHYSHLFKDK